MKDEDNIPKIPINGAHTSLNDDNFNYDYSSSPQKVHFISEERPVNNTYNLPNLSVMQDEGEIKRRQDLMYMAAALGMVILGVAIIVIFNIFNSMKLSYDVMYVPEGSKYEPLFIQFSKDGTCLFDDVGFIDCTYKKKMGKVVVDVAIPELGFNTEFLFKIKNKKEIILYKANKKNNYFEYIDSKLSLPNGNEISFKSSGETAKLKNTTTTKKTTSRNTSSNNEHVRTTTSIYGKENVSKLEIKEYDKFTHYAKTFFLHQGSLYAHNSDSEVDILILPYTAGGILEVIDPATFRSYLFAENHAGEIFYINNYVHSDQGMFDLTLVPNVKYVKRGTYADGKFSFITYDDQTFNDIVIDTGL